MQANSLSPREPYSCWERGRAPDTLCMWGLESVGQWHSHFYLHKCHMGVKLWKILMPGPENLTPQVQESRVVKKHEENSAAESMDLGEENVVQRCER